MTLNPFFAIAAPNGAQLFAFLFALAVPIVFSAWLIRFVNKRSGDTFDAHPMVVRAVAGSQSSELTRRTKA